MDEPLSTNAKDLANIWRKKIGDRFGFAIDLDECVIQVAIEDPLLDRRRSDGADGVENHLDRATRRHPI